jgi:RNA polymerase sigma factor (sigma-70 family)
VHDPGKTRHPDSWQAWFEAHGPALVLFARQWLRRHPDAEDAVQDGFVRFWRNRDLADDKPSYLYACVRSAALDHLRSESRRRMREHTAAVDNRAKEPLMLQTFSESQDTADVIEAALTRLPSEQREVVVMKVWGGLTFAGIAAALEINANTVASRYRLAISAMRQWLPEESVR